MSAKTMSSITDENRDLRKQIGCMNGIFQLFDRHHFLAGRRMSSHHHKRLIQGAQHQLDPQYATKAVSENTLEQQKEKPRISTESSRASYSSSSCSSTFSSLDFNRIAHPETLSLRRKNNPETPFPFTAMKEPQLLDLRDVVKDSMHREARGLSIKSLAKDERRGTVMKHIDSPRPLQPSKSKTPKPITSEGSTRVLTKVHEGTKNTKDERLTLHRFSYDGRESRDSLKWAVKQKELPRLSLDSKASSMKCSALESRLSFLGQDPHVENESSGHNRTSSVVAKLMGLENFPDSICTDENRTPTTKSCPKEAFLSKLASATEESNQNQHTYSSPRVSQNNPASPSPRFHSANLVKKPNTCSRFPIEPAPWRQHDSSQGSPKMATQSRKASTNNRNLSSSVYGEIEKRITEIQFQKSGKDLRALKQILEAMQKTREQLEDRTGESAIFTSQMRCRYQGGCCDQNSNLSMWKHNRSYHQAPTIEGSCTPKQLGSSVVINKPAKVMDQVRLPVSNHQGLKTQNPKYHDRKKAKDLTSKNKNDTTIAGHQRKKAETGTTSGRSFGMVSPRLQQNLQRIEGQSQPTTPSSDSGRVKKHCIKKLVEKGPQNRKNKVKAKDMQLSDDQLSELSNETRCSSYQNDAASVISESNSVVSQTTAEIMNMVHSVKTNAAQKENSVSATREHMTAVENVITVSEQPSPISVLDATFYCEDSPSPVKKISTVFRDESPSPDEAEWRLEDPNNLTDSTRSNHALKFNQKFEDLENSAQKLRLFTTEPDATAVDHSTLIYQSHNPDHRYINKILMTSGLFKDLSFISTTNQLISSCRLINPDMFHVLEQTEEIMEGFNGEVSGKNDKMQLNKKIKRKIIFDMVDEILVRKVTSGRLFTPGNKRTSPQGVLKEVYLEIDRVCKIPECNLDDEEDEMSRLLTADMKYQDDWADYTGEVPALVLDIERLIFKELINEVVTGEVKSLPDWPQRHCRKLFGK